MKRCIIVLIMIVIFITGCATNGTNSEVFETSNSDTNTFLLGEKNIELERRAFLSNKLELLIPEDFKDMPDEMAKFKYPSERRPTIILTNEDSSLNIAINYTQNPTTNEQIYKIQKLTKEAFENLYPSATWYSEEVKEIGERILGY